MNNTLNNLTLIISDSLGTELKREKIELNITNVGITGNITTSLPGTYRNNLQYSLMLIHSNTTVYNSKTRTFADAIKMNVVDSNQNLISDGKVTIGGIEYLTNPSYYPYILLGQSTTSINAYVS